jgi:hypothetical protein
VPWIVEFEAAFEQECLAPDEAVREELLAAAWLLEDFGPQLARPRVDTPEGSRHAIPKELRFPASGGVGRVAFAFDPRRRGTPLVAGDKSGVSEGRFCRRSIALADRRYAAYLQRLRAVPGTRR